MDRRTAEISARNISGLLESDGWKGWFLPYIQRLRKEDHDGLVKPQSKKSTAKRRARIELLDELMKAPASHLTSAREALKNGDDPED